MSGLLQTKDAFRGLVQRLAACPQIARYGSEEPETLTHAFSDLEESLRRFLDEQLPKLADPAVQGEELEDLLMDIREEFRYLEGRGSLPQYQSADAWAQAANKWSGFGALCHQRWNRRKQRRQRNR